MKERAFGQLIIRSETRYYAKGSIIADCREEAKGLMIITSGQVLVPSVDTLSALNVAKRTTA